MNGGGDLLALAQALRRHDWRARRSLCLAGDERAPRIVLSLRRHDASHHAAQKIVEVRRIVGAPATPAIEHARDCFVDERERLGRNPVRETEEARQRAPVDRAQGGVNVARNESLPWEGSVRRISGQNRPKIECVPGLGRSGADRIEVRMHTARNTHSKEVRPEPTQSRGYVIVLAWLSFSFGAQTC